MSANERFREALSSFASRRLGSKRSRFRSAVTLGFFVATAALIAMGPDPKSLRADGFSWGNLIFDKMPGDARVPRHDIAGEGGGRKRGHRFVTAYSHVPAHSLGASRQAICVRLCDGFSFPIGAYSGERGLERQETMCHADCPEAATALYLLPKGSDKIEDAIDARSGQNYLELPDAFHYKTVLDDACTCRKAGSVGPLMSMLRDTTLRRGDAVMTPDGLRVYHGSDVFPHKRSDFVALARSPDVPQSQRAAFGDLERASRGAHPDARSGPGTLFSEQPAPPAPALPPRARLNKQANRN